MAYWKKYRTDPYVVGQTDVYKISRTKIELFTQCPRCFWLDARLKIKRPNGPPFNINKIIDELFKKEFDVYRAKGKPHPLMADNQIKAVPFKHEKMDEWRHNFTGIVHLHEPTNFHVFGALDDLWLGEDGQVMVVDYKATSKDKPVKKLGPVGGWQDMYRRQMEVYQWLLKKNDLDVSDIGYFVYATGMPDRAGFNNVVEFDTNVFPHTGNSDWVEDTLIRMKKCLDGDIPEVGVAAMGGPCEHCEYAKSRTKMTLEALKSSSKKL